jgi:hypothetical protein
MNDNIERLCEELLHYDDMIFGWRETVERAAEAIVKECAELAEECYCGDTVKSLILQRFGVEP